VIEVDDPEVDENYGAEGICTTEGINEWVDARFRDTYIYYDQVPIVDPTEYSDPRDLVEDLRVSPDKYSSIREQAAQSNFFAEGETFGYGFRWGLASDSALRFSVIVKGSPMEAAGVLRGDQVLAINGIAVADFNEDNLTELFEPFDEPNTLTFTIATGTDQPRDAVITSGTYFIDPVAERGVFSWDDLPNRVGYIDLSTFIRTSEDELDEAVEYLGNSDITDLILDFRYNGGGYVYVAQKFASDKYSDENFNWLLEPQELNLPMSRIIVLTTENSASASEGLANALRPYIDVVLIGENTNGKPFTSRAQTNCDLSLNAMQGITTNGADESVLGGMIPTCYVNNDWLYPQADNRDALTNAALNYAIEGTCPATQMAQSSDRSMMDSVTDRFSDAILPSGALLDR